MAWHGRLKQALEQKGWSAVELARRARLPEQSVYKYLQGKVQSPRGTVIKTLAQALGVTDVWIMHGDILPASNHVAIKRIPLVKLFAISEGMRMTDIVSEAGESIPVPADDLSDHCMAVRVDDDAMMRVPSGSIVVVDRERPPEPGRHVLAYSTVVKRAVVRRWRATDYSGAGQLVADSPDYPPLPMSSADDGYVIGRVVMVMSSL